MKYFSLFLFVISIWGQQNTRGSDLENFDAILVEKIKEVQGHIDKFDEMAKNAMNDNSHILADRSVSIVSELVGVSHSLEYIRFTGTLIEHMVHGMGPALIIKGMEEQGVLIAQHLKNLEDYSNEQLAIDVQETRTSLGDIVTTIEALKFFVLKSSKDIDQSGDEPRHVLFEFYDHLLKGYSSLTGLAIKLNKDTALTEYSKDLAENLIGIKRSFEYIRSSLSFAIFIGHKSGHDKIIEYIEIHEKFLSQFNNRLKDNSDGKLAELINDLSETIGYYFKGGGYDWSISIAIKLILPKYLDKSEKFYSMIEINDNEIRESLTEEIDHLQVKRGKLNTLHRSIKSEDFWLRKRFEKLEPLMHERERLERELRNHRKYALKVKDNNPGELEEYKESKKLKQPRIDFLRKINKPREDILITARNDVKKRLQQEVNDKIKQNWEEISVLSIQRMKELASDRNKVNWYTKPNAAWEWSKTGGMYQTGGISTSEISISPRPSSDNPGDYETVIFSISLSASEEKLLAWVYLFAHKSINRFRTFEPSWERDISVAFNDNFFQFSYSGAAADNYMINEDYDGTDRVYDGASVKRFIDALLNDPDDNVVIYVRWIVDKTDKTLPGAEERIWSIETSGFRESFVKIPESYRAGYDVPVIHVYNGSSTQLFERAHLFYTTDTNKPYSGSVFSLYDDGEKKEEKTFKDGKKDGLWTWWHDNGQMWGEITYKDGKKDGLWTWWHKNGQKYTEATYKGGNAVGLSTEWFDNGQKKFEKTFKQGELNGLYNEWFENGQKKSKFTYKHGQLEGVVTGYNENGQKVYVGTFKNGKPDGLITRWHDNGQKKFEGIVKDGKMSKLIGSWNEDGSLKK